MSEALLSAFQRAASVMPAYRQLLHEHGVEPCAIVDRQTFSALCPILTKENTFDRFPIDQLCAAGAIQDLSSLLTSSGYGGRFSFGLTTRQQHAEGASMIDEALDQAFQVRSRRTLVINCLPMGVTFSSEATTVATTSVREDMVTALMMRFGAYYEQIVIVADPLFLRRLIDHGDGQRLEWKKYRIGVVLGEETFGEHFRSYVAERLGLNLDRPEDGYVMSSFGVGELGLHLCYETPRTIAIRRAAMRDPELAGELFGEGDVLPMVLEFNERRTFIEALDKDGRNYGRMTVSMLDTTLPVPLLRYQTGDIVRLLDPACVRTALRRRGWQSGSLPTAMLALAGRERDRLPNHSHIGVYRDALYRDRRVADRLTGAFRFTACETGMVRIHVQLAPGVTAEPNFIDHVRAALGIDAGTGQVIVTKYHEFPYGMGLDYERKFAYHIPGEVLAPV